MFGAVQLGLLAACVVLFVPMAMAGWHLSRNKVLFFSGALFITLAVGVHLTPYFSNISAFISSVPPLVVLQNQQSCISFLHQIVFDSDSWRWEKSLPVSACEFQKLGRVDASDLLNGSWIVVAGDSQARLTVVSLLSLILNVEENESIRSDLFKRHSNYQIVVDKIGLKLDFIWAPFETNLTELVNGYKLKKNYPDVLVIGSGLWHMLHVTDASDYGSLLQTLKKSILSLLPISPEFDSNGPLTGSVSIRSPHLFWLGMPMLINSMLNSEIKKLKMSDAMVNAYENELYKSKLLRQSGGPLLELDIRSLSKKCGSRCTDDGMHYNGVVYESAVQIMVNALLIESHQKLL